MSTANAWHNAFVLPGFPGLVYQGFSFPVALKRPVGCQSPVWDPEATTFPEFNQNLKWLGLDDIVTPISGETVEVAKTWDKDIGLLFIDAAHA